MHKLDGPRRVLAAALAALAGYVDAIGFLSANGYFVSFMSGNTTRLATEVVAAPHLAALPALLILGFVAGVAIGALVARSAGTWRKPAVLALVTLLLAGASVLAIGGFDRAVLGALVLAMGALNNAVQRSDTPIALTYLTGALVRIGQGVAAWLAGERPAGVGASAAMWLSLASGASLGAAAHLAYGTAALCGGAAFAAGCTLAGFRLAARRPAGLTR